MTPSFLRPGPLLAGPVLLAALAANAEEISLEDLTALRGNDVVVLGEVHDNPVHHLNQAAAITVIEPAAIVFEMIHPRDALKATPDLRLNSAMLGSVLEWEANGWPDFDMYYPIFLASGESTIFGAAMDRSDVRAAMDDGAAEVLGGSAAIFGLDQPLEDEEQVRREADQMAVHCDALPEDVLPGMVEAQRLRDAALARATVAAMAETGGPVVVIAGNGHARTDWGMARYLSRALPDAQVATVAQFEAAVPDETPFDFWFVTQGVERGDPCEAFR